MKIENKKVMRDVLIENICNRMHEDKSLFFLTADFGAPKLDKLKEDFKDRFINVGIAEQNLINVSTGLALEGFTVYAYAIAPFITMRAYEQVRNNLSLLSQIKEININMIGVGAGLSYDVSGPTHHCLEDISIMRTLPNIDVFSPSDWMLAGKFLDYSIKVKRPKYIRLDSKPLPRIYEETMNLDLQKGFYELAKGEKVCFVSTGYVTHTAIKVVNNLKKINTNIGLIDMFLLKPFNEDLFYKTLSKYNCIITIEEAFINKGGLDSLVSIVLENRNSKIKLKRMGFEDKHVFEMGGREHLHRINGLDEETIAKKVRDILKEI
ncbi:transketolase [Candidatus Desantisbacteria bacterium]|nr:transketolase [Candidatus Desantisbacteria bacterium]